MDANVILLSRRKLSVSDPTSLALTPLLSGHWNLAISYTYLTAKADGTLAIYQLFMTWNGLPECVALCENPAQFKKLLCSPVVYAIFQSRIPDSLLIIDDL